MNNCKTSSNPDHRGPPFDVVPDLGCQDASLGFLLEIGSRTAVFRAVTLTSVTPIFLVSPKANAQPKVVQVGDEGTTVNAPPAVDVPAADDKMKAAKEKKPTPEEKMAKRFPQPVRISYLVGLPMLDESNATLGHVQSVLRTYDGKIRLVIDYGGLFGFGSRMIAVPVEVCAMLGRQVAALDMPRAEFEVAPTWYGSGNDAVGPEETIQVAIMRR